MIFNDFFHFERKTDRETELTFVYALWTMQQLCSVKSSQNAQTEGGLTMLNMKGSNVLHVNEILENNRLNNQRQLTDTLWSFRFVSRVTYTVVTTDSVFTRRMWSTPVFTFQTFVYVYNYLISFRISHVHATFKSRPALTFKRAISWFLFINVSFASLQCLSYYHNGCGKFLVCIAQQLFAFFLLSYDRKSSMSYPHNLWIKQY